MSQDIVRSAAAIALVTLLFVSVIAVPIAATEDESLETEPCDYCIDEGDDSLEQDEKTFAGPNDVATTKTRTAFLRAKKAFHEARQEIQGIKKGDESPVADVPTFFDEEEDDDS
ncbi:MAG: hypothetical protein ACQETB_10985 [Halobacteriota archaeon]